MTVYRVLRKRFSTTAFDGEGAYLYGGRWSSRGIRLSYASEHQSLAMLEYFVHLDQDDPPEDLVLATADLPDDLIYEQIELSQLPANWREAPAPPGLRRFGNEFVQRAKTSILLVPSALVPREKKCLINPGHPDYERIILRELETLNYDPRMFKPARRRGHR